VALTRFKLKIYQDNPLTQPSPAIGMGERRRWVLVVLRVMI